MPINSTTRLTTAALLACSALLPATASAQRIQITVEPRVTALPAARMWDGSRTEAVFFNEGPCLTCTPTGSPEGEYTHSAKLTRGAMPMYGGRLAFTSPGGTWRVALDGAMGRGTMRAEVYDLFVGDAGTAPNEVPSSYGLDRDGLPTTITQLGVQVEHGLRGRYLALDLGGGAMAQQLRARTVRTNRTSTGSVSSYSYDDVTTTDPGLQASAAIGLSRGWLSGLRLSMRSTHVWRSKDLANSYSAGGGMQFRNNDHRWQWQPEVALGWGLPLVLGSPYPR